MFTEYFRCICGAIGVITDTGDQYMVQKSSRKRYLPGIDLRKLHRLQTCSCCDHCVNHYGLDLCACGSGEPVGKCRNELDCCGEPSQILFGRTCFRAADALI